MKGSSNILRTIVLFSLMAYLFTGCRPRFDEAITTPELREEIAFLAGDSLKGRYPGTPEDSVLTAYITHEMDIAGMVLPGKTGLQEVKVEQGYTVTGNNRLMIDADGGITLSAYDLRIPGFSSSDTVGGELILSTSTPAQDNPGPATGILVLPLPNDIPSDAYDAFMSLRSTCLHVSDLGYEAVIFLYDGPFPEMHNSKRLPLSIPVAAVSMQLARNFLTDKGYGNIFEMTNPGNNLAISTGITATIMTEVMPNEVITHNTLALLKGSEPDKSDEYVIVGAHHDHLGMGGRGSSSRRQDTIAIHYGADDNASGVAGVIELAQNLMSRAPERSFLFTTFAAEEMGLLGSRALTEQPVIDLENVQAMINIDMIGRLNEERQLQIGGIGTSPLFRSIIDSVNTAYNFSIAFSEAGYGPSDHASFYAKDIPVLFISTGAHTDYHTPDDRSDRINYEGMKEVLSFISDLALDLANMNNRLEFTLAGPKESSGSRGRQGMVTFGLMPDVMYDGNKGMPVSFVTEGKPAAIGGMQGGDIITAVDGKHVGNVHDYMDRLSELKEGQSVVVTVKRDGETLKLLLKL